MTDDSPAIDARTVSTGLIALGIGVLVVFFGATAVLAGGAPDWSADEAVVVGVQGPGSNGVVEAYGPDGALLWRVGGATSYHDVTALEDGRVLATFASGGHDDCGPFDPPCGRTGVRLLEPQPETGSATVDAAWSYPVRNTVDSEVHDAEPLPDGRVLVVGMDRERLLAVNVSTGAVEHIWNASSHYDAPPDPTTTDWLHLNDVDRIGEDRYLVSVRNANQLVVVEGGAVAEVINRDGDPTVLRGQHNPQWLGPGAVLVSDSENDRVVELHQAADGSWTVAWAVGAGAGRQFAWPRDADRLPNGNTLVTDSRNNRLVEVARNGSAVGILRTSALPYEADLASAGEPVGGVVYPAQDELGAGPGGAGTVGIEAVHLAWSGIVHSLPVPYWMGEWHLVVFVVASLLVDVGAGVRWWLWARDLDGWGDLPLVSDDRGYLDGEGWRKIWRIGLSVVIVLLVNGTYALVEWGNPPVEVLALLLGAFVLVGVPVLLWMRVGPVERAR